LTHAQRVIELAVDEAPRLGQHYIGTEHLLLGLIRQGDGVAIDILRQLGVNPDQIRAKPCALCKRRQLSVKKRAGGAPAQQPKKERAKSRWSISWPSSDGARRRQTRSGYRAQRKSSA